MTSESMARVTCQLELNGAMYLDYLLLYKRDARWVVVAKTTFVAD